MKKNKAGSRKAKEHKQKKRRNGIFMSANLPANIVHKINREMRRAS